MLLVICWSPFAGHEGQGPQQTAQANGVSSVAGKKTHKNFGIEKKHGPNVTKTHFQERNYAVTRTQVKRKKYHVIWLARGGNILHLG